MDSRSSILYLGIPLGTWFQTQVRVSLLFPLLLVICIHRLGVPVGVAVTVLVFLSVLVHEFAHVFVARGTGGEGDEILIWPLGGLAFVRTGPTTSSEFFTAAAGPVSNLLLLVASLSALAMMRVPISADVFHLLEIPNVTLETTVARDVLLLMASINFKLMCFNLLPAIPLDGGQMALSLAKTRMEPLPARIRILQVGQVIGLLVAVAGVLMEDVIPVFLAFWLTIYNLHEYFLARISEAYDEPITLQEFSSDDRESPRRPGMIERWRQRREEQRILREQQERAEAERRLDELLDKVHREGMSALSEAERRFLTRASARYRSHEH
ncbi:MAG: M50 family metallopeptidase [Planctomyces sp.]|nr:M50 family metallopeptidase [Planctomyces sp.]